jgi:hypothetical protein
MDARNSLVGQAQAVVHVAGTESAFSKAFYVCVGPLESYVGLFETARLQRLSPSFKKTGGPVADAVKICKAYVTTSGGAKPCAPGTGGRADFAHRMAWSNLVRSGWKLRGVKARAGDPVGAILGDAPRALLADRALILALCHKAPCRVMFHSDLSLRTDRQFVLSVVREEGRALQFVHESLLSDHEIMLASCRNNGDALQFAYFMKSSNLFMENVPANLEIVLASVSQNGSVLQHLPPPLQNCPAVVIAAVRQSGSAIQYASPELRRDEAIALAAVSQDGLALRYVPRVYGVDGRAILVAACSQNGMALEFCTMNAQMDPEIALAAVSQNGLALEHVSFDLKRDYQIVKAAVTQNGLALRLVHSAALLEALALAAVRQNGLAIELTPIGMKHDRQISLASAVDALARDGLDPRQHLDVVPLGDDLQVVLEAAAQNPDALHLLIPELRQSLRAFLASEGHALDSP